MVRESLWAAIWRTNRVLPILIGILLLVSLAAAAVAFWYVGPQLAALENDFLRAQQNYRDARKSGEVDESPQGLFRRGLADLQTLAAAIPDRTDFTGLIGDLFAMAGQSRLAIDRVNYDPAPVKGEEELLSYTVSFTVTGDYGQVKKFIYLIEHSPRLVAIEELNLNTSSGAERPDQINLGLRLTTYFRKPAP
ncbi:hypothetical protein JCM30471_12930 [Desulfuromonas carbonis]|uniref:type 4a pilus biogenesis protein PilO n=1 Tax=Desulfuromonas sp. DDH964 TaxID=1823759 RepID=UPI00078E0ACE|nr:type 4a pilus biogenesis protein PilO [Desulfuromonas sp. DDH964]AMV72777.1 type II secretion system protein PulO [Desulfuromonas sp. DDH964]